MPRYCFRCSGCDALIELPQSGPTTDSPLRHLDDTGVCGILRRDYRAENVATARVPGGGREHRS